MVWSTTNAKPQQLSTFQIIRRCIRDVITICSCAYLAKWLWMFNKEYGSIRNTITMIYGFIMILWTPRFSPRSIIYSMFAVGAYGAVVKYIWFHVNRDYLELICKSLSLMFGLKSLYLVSGLYWLRAYSPENLNSSTMWNGIIMHYVSRSLIAMMKSCP